jgi:hypothetical protein
MHYVTSMYHAAQGYYNQIPQNTFQAMAQSFTVGFVAQTLLRNDPKIGLTAGIVSATAAAIYALITPLFIRICGHNPLTWNEEMCRGSIAIIATGCIAAAFGNRGVIQHLFFFSIMHGLFAYLDETRRDLSSAHIMIVEPIYRIPVPVPVT